MELKIKHISPYLSYHVKFINDSYDQPLIVGGLNINYKKVQNILRENTFDLSDIKLVLRPLSDLTKEILVNGKKIIPLIELAKLSFKKWDHDCFSLAYENHVVFGTYYFSYDKKEMSFDCKRDYDGQKWDYNCYVPFQLELFNKLLEWHFDVFELIKNNLAIDINTLNK